MTNKSAQNILLIWNRMGDYHRARWQSLKQYWSEGEVYAADLGAADNLYQWSNTNSDNNYYRLSEHSLDKADFINRFRQFRRILKENNIGIVAIPGYGRMEYVFFLLWCKVKGLKVIMFAESWYGNRKGINFIKSFFLKMVCKRYFVSGSKAQEHFHKRLGIPLSQIVKGYSTIDNDHFAAKGDLVNGKKALLCVARFSPEKNHKLIFEAFLASAMSKTWVLHCVGAGPQLEGFQELERQYPESIKISTWADYHQLPTIYQSASVFVLASTFEPWGLVVNEAMAAGLPIIVSDQCGCFPDLVHKENGWVFPSGALNDLVNIFNEISLLTESDFISMGKRSQEIIVNYSVDSWAENFSKLAKQHAK